MSPMAIVLVLLSAAIHVMWNLYTATSDHPKTFSMLKGIVIIAVTLLALPIIPLRSITPEVWSFIMVTAPVHAMYIFALSTAYETGDISFVYPIARSAPALVPVVAFFALGERISANGVMGITVVVICVFLIQLRGETGSELRRIISSLKQKDSIWAFITLGAVVTYSVIDKAAMVKFGRVTRISPHMHGPIYLMLHASLTYILFSIYMILKGEISAIHVNRVEWSRAVIAGLGTMASYSLILHVMQTEKVSYIVALRQSSVLFAVLIGWIGMKEPHGRLRLLAAAAMLAGFYLVATA
ncbi:EamA family transporter [bacterium]|nr:EamA family transporter [bacterium]